MRKNHLLFTFLIGLVLVSYIQTLWSVVMATVTPNQAFWPSHAALIKLAISSDGKTLASVGQDGRIMLRNITSNQKQILQTSLNAVITSVIFSPDGKMLAGVGENAITLWEVASAQERSALPVSPSAAITAISFSPDGKTLASIGQNSEITLWDVESGSLERTLSGHSGAVTGIAFSPDGKILASGGQDTRTKLWDAASGQERLTLTDPAGAAVTDVAFSRNGQILASVNDKAQITLWEVSSGSAKKTLTRNSGTISGIAFSPDDQILASGSKNSQVTLWDVTSGRERSSLLNPSGAAVVKVVFSPEGRMLISFGEDARIVLWDITTNPPRQVLIGPDDLVEVAFSSNGQALAGITKNGQITIWDTASGTQQFTVADPAFLAASENSAASTVAQTTAETATTGIGSPVLDATSIDTGHAPVKAKKVGKHTRRGVTAVAINPTGTFLASAHENDKKIRLWNPTSGRNLLTFQGQLSTTTTSLALTNDGKRLISVGKDTNIRFWEATSGQQLQTLAGHEHPIRVVAISPDGRWVATAGEETRIMVWDAATGKLSKILSDHINFVNGLAFSPDGTRLASVGADARTLLWDTTTGQLLQTLLGHAGEINAVAFSPNGRFLATAGEDTRIIVRDALTGQQLNIFQGNQAPIRTLAFSPDSGLLASAGENTQVMLWNMATLTLSKTLKGAPDFINTLGFYRQNKNQNYLVAGCEGNQIIAWDVENGKVRWSQRLQVSSVAETPVADSANSKAWVLSGESPIANPMTRRVEATLPNSGILQRLLNWLLPAANAALSDPDVGPGGPILVINSAASPFGKYYAEILRNEGFNSFTVADITSVTTETLANYDIVILAAMPLSNDQVTMLTNWVNRGGNLIAMRPDSQLAGLLGLANPGTPISNGYLLIDTSRSPGNGIVNQTIQFHGAADRYTLNGASSLATLYSDATTATGNPALTLRTVGAGKAAAFTYDLATSVVYTRQGNPVWAAQERDGYSPIRSDDKFYGDATGDPQPDWVDLNKVAIPQADEQQRLLANLILEMDLDKKPLPRFWYFPRGKKAVVIMTGDDHGNGGTAGRWDQFRARSPAGCSVTNWECVRGTSYIYSNAPLTDAQAAAYNADGFEVGLHINTNCADFTPATLETFYSQQITEWTAKYSSVPPPITQRHHCIAWSDWVTGAKVQLTHGIRLDTSYYFWPPGWVLNRPGFFNGSGMPMRFADLNGDLINVYHAATQMTDESGQQYPYTIDTLLDKALGAEGYYGVFTVNAHTDVEQILEADAVVTSALARGVPIVSSRQMLDWLDGRNGSSFGTLTWNGNTLSFTVSPAPNANGLQVLVPLQSTAGIISSITSNGKPVVYTTDVIKGVNYAVFAVGAGPYTVTYAADTTSPTVTATLPNNGATGINQGTSIKATFSKAMDSATITGNTFQLSAPGGTVVAATVSYNAVTRTATLTPTATLAASTLYTATVKGGANGVKDLAENTLATPDFTWSFTTAAGPVCPCSAWDSSIVPGTASANDPNSVELGVKFRTDIDGYITGIRFYKGSANTGTHIGNLWTTAGQKLATATFSNETASGWQQVTFSNPVPVTANTVYVASYYAPNGGYAFNGNYFATAGVDNSPIHLLRDGEDGPNGIYRYGAGGGFPTNTYNATNYWVDVVFTTSVAPDTTPPTVVSRSPANGATGVTAGTTVTATFSEAMNPATINTTTFELRDAGNTLVPAAVTYTIGTNTATLTPSSALAANTTYTATIKGGDSGVKDVVGKALASDQSWSFTTATAGAPNCSGSTSSIWPTNPIPSTITDSDTSSVELGVKFKSTVNGYVCGIRFYKGSTNSGTHIGNLWSSSGQLLASAAFQNETASGWQQLSFSTPVAITANTIYVASYHAPVGRYSADNNYFTAGVTTGPLYAFSSAESDGNGVYLYGSGGFPTNTYQASNYWVDVVFTSDTGPDTTAPAVTTTSPLPNTTGVNPASPVTATFSEAMKPATINTSTFALRNPGGMLVAATVSYAANTATLMPGSALAENTTYTATVKGGPDGAKDLVGNPLAADQTWSFTTATNSATTSWYAGDMHVHRSCGGSPEAILSLYDKMSTHDLAVISLLADMGNGEVQNPVTDLPLVNGQDASISTPGRIVHWDAEWHWDATYGQYAHQALGGHVVALGLTGAHQIWEEYTYPIFQWAHQQNGIAGFVHMQYLDNVDQNGIPQSLTCCTPIEYPVEVALGAADFIAEDVTGSDSTIQAYYRLLNTGFRPGLAAGSDYPCGVSEVGPLLTYVKVAGGQMTYRNWIEGIKAGRTVISRNGHNEFLDLKVNDNATPGDEIKLAAAGSVQVQINWTANQNLSGTIELVQNGVVIASQPVTAARTANLTTPVNFTKSGWLAARRMDSNGHQLHTGAVFVIVNNAPVRASAADAQFYVQWIDNLLTKTSPGGAWNSYFPTKLTEAQARYQAAKAVYQQIAVEADVTAPSAPTGLNATVTSATQINLSWAASTDNVAVTGYRVERCQGAGCSSFAQIGTPTATSFPDSGLTAGTTYRYRVRATDAAGNLSDYSTIAEATTPTPDTEPPTAPTGLNATATNATQISLTWTASTDNVAVTGYQVERCQGTGCSSFAQIATPTATSFVDTGLTNGTTYQYRVRATDVAGNLSAYSAVATAVIPQPAAITTTSLPNGTVGVAYSALLTASGGITPYAWSVASGSLPPGLTLNASGTITGTPTAAATYPFTVQVSDNSTPVQTLTKPLSITTSTVPTVVTIWPNTATPALPAVADGEEIEVGVKFRSDSNGFIMGIRFYKGTLNTGIHTGSLWSSNGQLLARATFSNETVSDWQQVIFATPVAITANTVYVASCHSSGYYAASKQYFVSSGVDNPPLHALLNGESGGNGVYQYGTSAFPTNTYQGNNYWVDVMFTTSTGL